MRRKCNLELTLMPPSISDFSPKNCSSAPCFSMEDKENRRLEKQEKHLTIFSNGKLVVSDATELQAKAIIYLASREMEKKRNQTPSPVWSDSSSPSLQSQTNHFMKRSLQRFLLKRKSRIQTTSPYHH